MPGLTIDVPADRRDDLLRELLNLYWVKADALHDVTGRYLQDERSPDAVLAHRAELASIDALIEQLGWRLGACAGGTRLVGDGHLLAEIGRGVLHRAVDDLVESLSNTGLGPENVEAIGRSLRRVMSLFELLEALRSPKEDRDR